MKRVRSALLVTALTCGMVVTPVFAEPSVDDLKKDKEAAESQVNSLRQELTDLLTKISQLEGDLISKGQEITKAEEDLSPAEEKEKKQYEDMKLRIKFMYEEGDTSFLETLISAESFTDLVNKAEYVQNVHSYDRKMLEEYIATKQEIADLKSDLEKDMSNLESMQVEFENDKKNLDATLESKKSEISDLDSQIQAAVEKAAEEQRRREEEQQQANNNTNNNTNNNLPPVNGGGNGGGSNPTYPGQGNTAVAQKIVSAAYSQLGVPYKWGGSTPFVGLDCSGLVQYCHAVAGISLPHYSESQYAGGKKVSNPEPGDICWKPGHVAIYIGGGMMIEAQQTGTNIMISPVRAQGYARYW